MKISIGNDHAGPEYKKAIVQMLQANGYQITNYGTDSSDSVDYPDFAHPVALDVENKVSDFGIIICGSGNGIAMSANKHQGIRAALCWTKEIAVLARQHNDANILSLGARFVSTGEAKDAVRVWLRTPFSGDYKYIRRVKKIDKILREVRLKDNF